MNQRVKELCEAARRLTSDERAALIDELLAIAPALDSEIERAWAEEAEERMQSFLRGEVQAIPADEALGRLSRRS